MKAQTFWLILFTLLQACSKAEQPDSLKWTNYSTINGLSSNDINVVTIDKSGKIWIGTNDKGISVFDGKAWTYYTSEKELANNFIRDIVIDTKSAMWVVTDNKGISHFDGVNWTTYNTSNGLPNDLLYTITFDSIGNSWLATNIGAYKYDGLSWKQVSTNATTQIAVDS